MRQIWLAKLTRALLYFAVALIALLLMGLYGVPALRQLLFGMYELADASGVPLAMAFFTAMGLLALWILLELIGILRTVDTDPFVPRNVLALFRIGCAAEAAGLAFFASCFIHPTFMMAVSALVMALCGLFALVLCQVFRRAVEYKQENDLTI
ncbi:MAG: DUF2975 domain-containing protein [Christensenellaceae bacterium]|jgi:hypothetical protein|nr:DUF2975 domain-containing protein [Christensenellaceae bacterium]